jgi:hypothetical protein
MWILSVGEGNNLDFFLKIWFTLFYKKAYTIDFFSLKYDLHYFIKKVYLVP